jgi:hypothetical protein
VIAIVVEAVFEHDDGMHLPDQFAHQPGAGFEHNTESNASVPVASISATGAQADGPSALLRDKSRMIP